MTKEFAKNRGADALIVVVSAYQPHAIKADPGVNIENLLRFLFDFYYDKNGLTRLIESVDLPLPSSFEYDEISLATYMINFSFIGVCLVDLLVFVRNDLVVRAAIGVEMLAYLDGIIATNSSKTTEWSARPKGSLVE